MISKRKSRPPVIIRLFCLAFLLIPLTGFAGFKVSGRIINADNGKPVANATIFLNHSLISATTNTGGFFILKNVRPGQYDLVVALKGGQPYQQTIAVTDSLAHYDITLSLNALIAAGRENEPDPDREGHIKIFKRFLLGESADADQCKIVNPEILDTQYDPVTLILTAKADGFLTIENLALGYRLKYLLTGFSYYLKADAPELTGDIFFEEMDGSPMQKAGWQSNRIKIYSGSAANFFRSLTNDESRRVGFVIFKTAGEDSANRKKKISESQPVKFKSLKNVEIHDMVRPTVIKGRYSLTFPDSLYVTFRNDRAEKITDPRQNSFATLIRLFSPYVYFDDNGVIINPGDMVFKGYWKERPLPELLPVDFAPGPHE